MSVLEHLLQPQGVRASSITAGCLHPHSRHKLKLQPAPPASPQGDSASGIAAGKRPKPLKQKHLPHYRRVLVPPACPPGNYANHSNTSNTGKPIQLNIRHSILLSQAHAVYPRFWLASPSSIAGRSPPRYLRTTRSAFNQHAGVATRRMGPYTYEGNHWAYGIPLKSLLESYSQETL